MNNDTEENPTSSLPTSVWKILNSKNGDKYITFAGNTSLGSSSANLINAERSENNTNNIKVYKMRWYILTVICLANISNAINWINFSPIADYTGDFYSIDFDKVNYLSLIYLITATPAGFFSFWLIDSFGVKLSLNLGSWFNLIGSLVRLLSALDFADGTPIISNNYKYNILFLGQFCCSLAQPFVLFVATKFATNWFSDDQRALANTIALSSNTFGILIGAVISPLIVNSSVTFVNQMCFLHLVSTGVAFVPTVMSCFITRSTPPTPPSYSVSETLQDNQERINNEPNTFKNNFNVYLTQVVKLLKSRDFLILLFSFGIALGGFNAFTTLIEQIVCTRGYSDNDSGYFSGAILFSGLIGSLFAGIILDKTKRFEEMAKFCFCMATLGHIGAVVCFQYDNDKGIIYYLTLFSFIWFGFFGLPLLPICMDMSVECVYPIPEATSTGLLFIAGQITGVLMIVLYPKTAKAVSPGSYEYNIQTCTLGSSEPSNNTSPASTTTAPQDRTLSVYDYRYPLYFQTLLFFFTSVGFVWTFKCAYLRLRSERKKLAEQILHSATTDN